MAFRNYATASHSSPLSLESEFPNEVGVSIRVCDRPSARGLLSRPEQRAMDDGTSTFAVRPLLAIEADSQLLGTRFAESLVKT